MSSWVLWWLGRPDAALDEIGDRGGGRAPRVDAEPGDGRHFLCLIRQLRRGRSRPEQAQLNAAFAGELGFLLWQAAALVAAGTERARMGNRAGLDEVGRGLALLGDGGTRSDLERARDAGRGAPRGRLHGRARHRRG